MTTCPGCGCAEGETPNDECWPCQTDGEARIGESASFYGFEPPELMTSAAAGSVSAVSLASACD